MRNQPFSCDSFIVLPDATTNGHMLFGKNSDRPAGEAQPLRFHDRRRAGGELRLAHVTVPDAPAFRHIGASPFWCWGYEFGINEHHVVIGNEAQFTRPLADAIVEAGEESGGNGIIGMEFVRLGLERTATAEAAVRLIADLLERYGQWASGKFGLRASDGAYDNSYLIADPQEAWVLETAGRQWVARRITSGVCSISNEPSIRGHYDLSSEGLVSNAIARNWMDGATPFDYARVYGDPNVPLQVSRIRQRRSEQLLRNATASGGVSWQLAFGVLRDHLEGTFLDGPRFNAARPDFHTLCMHEHPSGFTWGNTAGSIVADLGTDAEDLAVVWWTPLTPCTGAYIPIFLEASPLPRTLGLPGAVPVADPASFVQPAFDPASFWWRSQNRLDASKGDYLGSSFNDRQPELRGLFDAMEIRWIHEVAALREQWRSTRGLNREAVRQRLAALTVTAIEEVDEVTRVFFSKYAPEAANRSIDNRWGGVCPRG
jgi:secernin